MFKSTVTILFSQPTWVVGTVDSDDKMANNNNFTVYTRNCLLGRALDAGALCRSIRQYDFITRDSLRLHLCVRTFMICDSNATLDLT